MGTFDYLITHMKNLNDEHWMRRCAELVEGGRNDLPIGAVVICNGEIVAEHRNETSQTHEFHRHAELLALLEAEKKLTSRELPLSTLYSSVEPCAMCSFAVRKLNIGRVVFALRSPMMGGYSKWKILQDDGLVSAFSIDNGTIPEVIPDLMKGLIMEGWERWNREKWERLSARGVFT